MPIDVLALIGLQKTREGAEEGPKNHRPGYRSPDTRAAPVILLLAFALLIAAGLIAALVDAYLT